MNVSIIVFPQKSCSWTGCLLSLVPLKRWWQMFLSVWITSRMTTVCRRCSSFPFISEGCAVQSASLSSARDALSLHIWQSASLGSKKHNAADIFSLRLEKCFVAPKLVSVGRLPALIRVWVFGLPSWWHTNIVAHCCLMFCADAATFWLVMDTYLNNKWAAQTTGTHWRALFT